MSPGWMYFAGVVIAKYEGRIDDFIDIVRETADLEMQTEILLRVADEENRPDLLEEAAGIWEEHVFQEQHHADEDFETFPVYDYICMLAARFNNSDIFEATLSRMSLSEQASTLSDASQFGNESYLERAVQHLESVEIDTEDPAPLYVMERALQAKDYARAVRALTLSQEVLVESEFFEDVVASAKEDGKLDEMREAVLEHAQGLHLYYFALELAKAGDTESIYTAAETLPKLSRAHNDDGDSVLYYFTKLVAEASENFGPEVQTEVKGLVKKFLNDVFYEAYTTEDLMTAFYSALGLLKIDKSLEPMNTLLFDKGEKAVENVVDTLVERGYWGVYGPTALIVCVIDEVKPSLTSQNLIKRHLRSGKEPFRHEEITREADEMLIQGLITQTQYGKLAAFLERDI